MSATLEVRIDDGLRLAGALLAASDWPDYEQSLKAYKAHRTADAAHKFFAPQREHPAVQAIRQLAGQGQGLNQIYAHALNGDWPADLGAQVEDFKAQSNLAAFLDETQADWAQAEGDAREVLARADLHQFLVDLLGPQPRALMFMPQLLYPGRGAVACGSASEAWVCVPPPKAWGTSLPWRYNERPDEALAMISEAFARHLFETALPPEHGSLASGAEAFALAAAVLFLRQAEGEAAGDQFMVMEKKTRGLKQLPAVVARLEPILANRRAGQYPAGLADYASQLSGAL
jgi:hypothetical protein